MKPLLDWLERTWQQAPPALRRHWPWIILGGIVAGFVLVLAFRPDAPKDGGSGGEESIARGAAGAVGAEGKEGDGPLQTAPAPGEPPRRHRADAGAPLSPTVKLTFRTFPARRASVMWGSKRLGFTDRGKPLVVERPRDSGPLDVVVRSEGFLPVHARAFTFDDAFVDVRITPLEKKDTVYGYQQPLTDAGAPPPAL